MNTKALSGIRTRDRNNQATTDLALDRTVTGIGQIFSWPFQFLLQYDIISPRSWRKGYNHYAGTTRGKGVLIRAYSHIPPINQSSYYTHHPLQR